MLKDSERFFKVYSNLPLNERENTIVIIDDAPISWNLAHEEIRNETQRGAKILKTLKDLNFI